jgi:hypothetical protein
MKNTKYIKPGVKSSEAEISIGEGLPLGRTHTGKNHERVVDAKHDHRTQKRAQDFNERSENNDAEVEGGGIKE